VLQEVLFVASVANAWLDVTVQMITGRAAAGWCPVVVTGSPWTGPPVV